MLNQRALQTALVFFMRFLVAAALLSLLYQLLYERWITVLIALTSPLLEWSGTSLHISLRSDAIALVHTGLNGSLRSLRFAGHQTLHLHAVAAMALLLSPPHLSLRKKLAACAVALLLFTLFEVGQLYTGILLSLDQYWLQLSAAEQRSLFEDGWRVTPTDRLPLEAWFGWWNMWGSSGLALLIWIYLTGGRSSREPSPEQRNLAEDA